MTPFSVAGGYVADSLAMHIWTESILEQCAGQFEAVFLLAGHDTPAVVAEVAAMAAPGRFLASAAVVKWDRSGVLRATILAAERPHAPAAVAPGTRRPRAPRTMSPTRGSHDVGEVEDTVAAALSLLRPDVRAQVESAVWQRVATLYATVTSAGDAGYNRSDVTDRIRTAATWLRENTARPISIAQAAKAVGMSERSFLRHFRSETTVTPPDFLRDVRLDAVCRLLTETRLPVDKIARRCGMGSGESLSRVFRQQFSPTPTAWRETRLAQSATITAAPAQPAAMETG